MKRLSLLTLLTLTSLVWAKPMPSPTVTEGVSRSSVIVVAEYTGYQAVGKPDYFSGPKADYKVERTLKGKSSEALTVRYDFHDGSACLPDTSWKFSAKVMPKPGSRWILLLTSAGPPAVTYRGDFGRLPYSQESLARIKAEL